MRSKPVSGCLMAALLCCGQLCFAGDTVERKPCPAPVLTPEVRAIQSVRKPFRASKAVETPLPVAVDNSRTKFFPPVINQAGGSCAQASGIGYMFTYEVNRLLGRDASASAANRFSYLFSWNMLNDGIDQGDFVERGLFLAQRYGIMTEQDYGTSGTYQFKWATGYGKYLEAMRYRTRDILTFDDSIPLMKRWLYDAGDGSAVGGVLTFSGYSSGWQMDNSYNGPSATGYHSLLTGLATSGSHAMTIVGYDELVTYTDGNGTTHTGAFIVANSWGTVMHDAGRYYLPYDFFRDGARDANRLSHTVQAVRVATHNPLYVFRLTVDCNSRNDIAFQVASHEDVNRYGTIGYHRVQAFYNAGGDYPMQGQYGEGTMELALDVTDYVSGPSDGAVFYVNVQKSAVGKVVGEGRVTSLSLMDYSGGSPVEHAYAGTLPRLLLGGNNEFAVALRDFSVVSASNYNYRDSAGAPSAHTFLVRTAAGSRAKMRFSQDNQSGGSLTITYQLCK